MIPGGNDSAELARVLRELGMYHWLVCDWRERTQRGVATEAKLDAFLDTAGVTRMCDGEVAHAHEASAGGWSELTEREARHLLAFFLEHPLTAYGPVFPTFATKSNAAVDPFFRVFTRGARYFTNRAGDTWTPKTCRVFEAGVVAVDDTMIGVVWFAADD